MHCRLSERGGLADTAQLAGHGKPPCLALRSPAPNTQAPWGPVCRLGPLKSFYFFLPESGLFTFVFASPSFVIVDFFGNGW